MSTSRETLGLLIKHIQHRNFRLLEAKLAPLAVSIVQMNALRTIDRYPGCCLHRLATLTFNSDQAFGMLATRLRRDGLIERCPAVGRAARHTLTSRGKKLLRVGSALVEEALSETFAPLSEAEGETLAGLLRKLLEAGYPADP